eukprot:14177208-Heterocapsa_arctica.AAC.1
MEYIDPQGSLNNGGGDEVPSSSAATTGPISINRLGVDIHPLQVLAGRGRASARRGNRSRSPHASAPPVAALSVEVLKEHGERIQEAEFFDVSTPQERAEDREKITNAEHMFQQVADAMQQSANDEMSFMRQRQFEMVEQLAEANQVLHNSEIRAQNALFKATSNFRLQESTAQAHFNNHEAELNA